LSLFHSDSCLSVSLPLCLLFVCCLLNELKSWETGALEKGWVPNPWKRVGDSTDTLSSVLQCVAQCVAVCGKIQLSTSSTPQIPTAVCCSVLQCVAVCCSVLQCVANLMKQINDSTYAFCSTLFCVAVCCSVLQYVAVCCSVFQTQ